VIVATVLRRLADSEVVAKGKREELATLLGDLRDELDNLLDALTELAEAEPSDRADAAELVTGRADDVLAELASVGLIAPRLGNGQHTGRELTLKRLTKPAAAAYDLHAGGLSARDINLAPLVEAVLVEAGYLPAAR
jgi:hypothetical protein